MKWLPYHLPDTVSLTDNTIHFQLFCLHKIRRGLDRKANEQPEKFLLILDYIETENCMLPVPGKHVVSVQLPQRKCRSKTHR